MCGIFMDREQLAERFAEAASMPRDVVMGASVITITGRNEICIENYRGILEYTDLLIRVQTKSGQIRLSGKNLQIERSKRTMIAEDISQMLAYLETLDSAG